MPTCQATPIGSNRILRNESADLAATSVPQEREPSEPQGCATPAHVPLFDATVPASAKACADRLRAILGTRYELKGLLGQGGMGLVFLAKQRDLDRPVAIKVLHPHLHADAEFRRRFCDEAHTQSQLAHPGILPVYELREDDEIAFFVMQYIDGTTLRARLDDEPRPPLPWVVLALVEISSALAFAHRSGVVHRDVKPENLLIDRKTDRFLLCDFGVAKIAAPVGLEVTRTFSRIGTLRYVAPEQIHSARDVDGRADQYALGILAYEMLAGRPPFDSPNPAEVVFQHRYQAADSLTVLRPDIPPAICAAIHRAIEKDPADRFESLDDFSTALDCGVVAEHRDQPQSQIHHAGRWKEAGVFPGGVHGTRLLRVLAVGLPLVLAPTMLLGLVNLSDSDARPTAHHLGVDLGSSDRVTTEFGNGAGKQDPAQLGLPLLTPGRVVPEDVSQAFGHKRSANDSLRSPDDIPAVAKFTVSPPSGMLGNEFSFDASGSRSAQGTTDGLRVRWDWDGDGVWDTPFSGQLQATHRFSGSGTMKPRLEVIDLGGRSARRTRTVRIDAPMAAEPAIRDQIAVFVDGATAENLTRLRDGAYDGSIPGTDEALLRRIFSRAEDICLVAGSERIILANDGSTAAAKVRLAFHQERTGEPGTLELQLSFERDPKSSTWHLRSLRMR